MGQKSTETNSIGALEQAFDIISTLREQESLTLTELSDQLDMPTSTTHVYLQTLEQEGFVVREGRRYRNGLKFLEVGGHVRQQIDLYEAAQQVLNELAIQTGERAGLGIEENGKRVLLCLADGTNAVSDNIPIGEFTEMHWTSLGKCLLAHLPQSRQSEIIAESDLPRATENTITDEDTLHQELHAIREKGYAIENEERREGIRSLAVPILTPDDEVLGSIGLTGPTNRFDAEQISQYVSLLESKSNVIKLKTVYY